MDLTVINKLREELDLIDNQINREKDKNKKKVLFQNRDDKYKSFFSSFTGDQKKQWIEKELSNEAIVFSEFFGRYAENEGLTTSQIRNIFGEVKRLQMKSEKISDVLPNLRMLKPKLAYAAARAKEKGTEELSDLLSNMIDSLTEPNLKHEELEKRFENFSNFFEAILAYHKAYGGK